MKRVILTALVAVLLTFAPVGKAMATPDYISDLGYGMAAIGVNVFYIPAKLLYGLGGGLVGTLAYGLTVGNLEAAHNIWSPSLGGTWILTPEMMAGKNPILFSGESYEPPAEKVGGN